MSYIGQGLPADTFQGFVTDSFTGDGSATTFTLSKEPFSEDTLIVVINNVIQKPTTNFTVSGTTLTIVGSAVASGDVIYAIHMGGPLPIGEANKLDLNGASDQLILDADGDTTISADTDDQIDIKVGDVDILNITNSSSDAVITQGVQDKDILFKGNDGGSAVTALTLDMSDAGAATLNNGLTLTDGDLTLASGHGINFAATSDVSGMSSELLDDYEEGTWDIIVEDHSDNAMTLNSAYDLGTYIKIGGQVTITGYFNVDSVASASGSTRISGLPFSIPNNSRNYSAMPIGFATGFNISAGTALAGVAILNTNNVNLTSFDDAAGTTNVQASEFTNDGQAIFSMTYSVI